MNLSFYSNLTIVDFHHIPTSSFLFQIKQSHFYRMSRLLNLLPCLLPLLWICIYSFSNEVSESGQSSNWGLTNTRQGAKQMLPNHLRLDQNSMIELTHNWFGLNILPCWAAVSDTVHIICVFYFSCWSVALCPSPYFIPSSGFPAIPPFYHLVSEDVFQIAWSITPAVLSANWPCV